MADDTNPSALHGAGGPEGLVPEADEIIGTDPGGTETNEDRLARELIEVRREHEEMRQNMLRALADAENVRRRATRDVADARTYAVANFARDLLNVSDNFKRALEHAPDTQSAELSAELRGVIEGVQMTERELSSVFEKHGVKEVDPIGERFDPNRHQAMFEVENPDVPAGTVIQTMQAGAVIGDRVLRPAMVGVAKGGPKAASGTEPEDQGAAG